MVIKIILPHYFFENSFFYKYRETKLWFTARWK